MPQKIASSSTHETVHKGLLLQLFVSHSIAVSGALITYAAWSSVSDDQVLRVLSAICVGGVLGLGLTANIQYSLYILGLALKNFVQGQTVEYGNNLLRWPLIDLFTSLSGLNHSLQNVRQQAQQTSEFREQLLHQATETAALEERTRMARELHDSIKQQIFSISISAAAAKAQWDGNTENARDAVNDIQRSAKEAQVEMQALLQQLRADPLEHVRLDDALRTQAEALGYRIDAHVIVDIGELPSLERLLPGTNETVFRIVQEAFANIARHARAHTVWLTLSQREEALHLEIRDDGQGFSQETVQKGMGLANMQERVRSLNGSLAITSSVGQGTTISITLPLLQTPQAAAEQKRIQQQVRRMREGANAGFQLAENVAPLATILLIGNIVFGSTFTVPFIVTGICLLIVLYGYVQGRLALTRAALYVRDDTLDMLALYLKEHAIRLWLARLAIIGAVVLLFLEQSLVFSWFWWLTVVGILLSASLFVLERRRLYRTRNRYYTLLPKDELGWQLSQTRARITNRLRTLLIIAAVILYIYVAVANLTFPLKTGQIWTLSLEIFGLLAWGSMIFVDYVQVRQWQEHDGKVE